MHVPVNLPENLISKGYSHAVAGGKGENLTCLASWLGVHGDGTIKL